MSPSNNLFTTNAKIKTFLDCQHGKRPYTLRPEVAAPADITNVKDGVTENSLSAVSGVAIIIICCP